MSELVARDLRVDIRDGVARQLAILSVEPDVVLHLAAQPLMRESYRDPRYTYETNALGTLSVLQTVEHTPSVLVRHDFHGDWNYTLLPDNTP